MDLNDSIDALKRRLSLDDHPYFAAIEQGRFGREDFVETQIQFMFAVVFFSRPMAVLASRLPRPEMRMSILHNVFEEHGEGDLRLSHEKTFIRLLRGLGVSFEQIEARALWPEVRAFNTALTGVCAHDDPITAVAAMGMIEDLFSGFSARLGRGIVANGWLGEDDLVHYGTHEVLDEEHAEEFYAIIRPMWAASARARYQITQGLELGAYLFTRLYRDLYEARTRRDRRDVEGPHSVSEGWYLSSAWFDVPREDKK